MAVRNVEQMIAQGGHSSAALAGESQHRHAGLVRGFDGAQHVGAVARRGKGHQHVAGASESGHLTGKDVVVAVVVAHGGQRGRVHGKGHGGQGRTLHEKASQKFAGHVLRVGGASAVAAHEDLAAAGKTARQSACRLVESGRDVGQEGEAQPGALLRMFADDFKSSLHMASLRLT